MKMEHGPEYQKQYSPKNRQTKKTDCHPTILDGNTLLSGDGEYMTHEVIKDKCDKLCKNLKYCHEAVDMLAKGQVQIATAILETMESTGD